MAKGRMTRRDLVNGLVAGVGGLVLVSGLMGVDTITTRMAEEARTKNMEAAGSFTPGTYSAEAQGFGMVGVTATFNETNITDLELDVSQETPEIGGAAADTLKDAVLTAQSAEIDGVAGASLTSEAVRQAVQSVINQASGVADDAAAETGTDGAAADAAEAGSDDTATEAVADAGEAGSADAADAADTDTADAAADTAEAGTADAAADTAEAGAAGADQAAVAAGSYTPGSYSAVALGFGNVTATVTFDETSITDITLDTSEETPEIGGAAADTLRDQVLAAQSAQIDGVAGASLTSNAVCNAVTNAMVQAATGDLPGAADSDGDAAEAEDADAAGDAAGAEDAAAA